MVIILMLSHWWSSYMPSSILLAIIVSSCFLHRGTSHSLCNKQLVWIERAIFWAFIVLSPSSTTCSCWCYQNDFRCHWESHYVPYLKSQWGWDELHSLPGFLAFPQAHLDLGWHLASLATNNGTKMKPHRLRGVFWNGLECSVQHLNSLKVQSLVTLNFNIFMMLFEMNVFLI